MACPCGRRRRTERHDGVPVRRAAPHRETRWRARAAGGAAQRDTAVHRPLTGRCILPMMGTCTASRIRCGGTSHDAATRHTRATTRGPQLCMAARMREGTQAHTAASMSACPRAPGQARYVLLHVPAHVVPGPVCRWALRRAGPRARARARCSMTALCRLAPAPAGVFCSPSFSSLQPRPRPRRSSCLDQSPSFKNPPFL